jgi:hypothetical protein
MLELPSNVKSIVLFATAAAATVTATQQLCCEVLQIAASVPADGFAYPRRCDYPNRFDIPLLTPSLAATSWIK